MKVVHGMKDVDTECWSESSLHGHKILLEKNIKVTVKVKPIILMPNENHKDL